VAGKALGEDLLTKAIAFERQTRDFYADFANKVKNRQSIKKMVQLAKDENRHAQLLMKRLKKLYKKDFDEGAEKPPKRHKFQIAESAIHDKADVLEIVSVGILFENGSIKNYEDLLDQTTDDEDVKLLSELIKFEIGHKKALQKEYDRITKVGSFFETGITSSDVPHLTF